MSCRESSTFVFDVEENSVVDRVGPLLNIKIKIKRTFYRKTHLKNASHPQSLIKFDRVNKIICNISSSEKVNHKFYSPRTLANTIRIDLFRARMMAKREERPRREAWDKATCQILL